ncbi:cobalamin biosynthesis protein CbiD [Desulfonema ishimotonii]|uniref:Cobalt-precorrin-5B C(1)-methyltransferase n=1 Tax=Desulfonema ishimotonii TaxID=45657 RepID=A0A401G4I8_9BACT|nr:cobalt-precorrin-5B (C(1))-methyltransferase CbiD [Desulfonema ishimotonii]GBC64045.1 cobalamin biosynthesis protein CbiD [Desulfonema ishimotonii]
MTQNKKKRLRAGFTTGTAAAAATKGALLHLLTGSAPVSVRICLLTGDHLQIPVCRCTAESNTEAICTVIKDAGDDPDVTHRAEIGARVTLPDAGVPGDIRITGGEGVGRVTKPGLEIPPGEPAINTGPRKMIRQAVREALDAHRRSLPVCTEIFVPDGAEMARHTLNGRLGIIGGISILGTTGVVRPMSHDAYIATIRSAMSVARAVGLDQAVLTTGRRSEKHSQALWPHIPEEGFIQIGDFFRVSLESAVTRQFRTVTLAVFFGKAVKMAQGVPHTHAAKSSLTLSRLSGWAFDLTGDREFADRILNANTARHAFDFITEAHPGLIDEVGHRMVRSARKFAGPDMGIRGVIYDFGGHLIFDSHPS